MPFKLTVFIFFSVIVLRCESPGEGKKALEGIKQMYIIQDSIYQYRIKNNQYPKDLSFLAAKKLPFHYTFDDSKQVLIIQEYKPMHIFYKNYGDYFDLELTYSPPGKNRMKFNQKDMKWEIS
ncbi:MAG TPA: hypothetical protein PKN56_21225, partial [Leptospiraceae bacterium]|nr:hypothetical protein [Leptospiraceae bacterium]